MTLVRCKKCVMPSTRPDVPFTDGVCQACINHENRPLIDWAARKAELLALLDRHDGTVIVPSSGGKDSSYIVLTLLDLGADVTIVTARTCHLTPIGRANIDNLARYARTIEVVPNITVRARLNRMGLELVGDISWPEHVSIFTTPFRVASQLGINLIMYGENPQDQYGGPQGTEQARTMTARWVSEFGGFLGLRPRDLIGMDCITARDMEDYQLPQLWTATYQMEARGSRAEAHFLGQYIQWDSRRNLRIAEEAGMQVMVPTEANWWRGENLDNAQTGLHDYFGWLKYGYGRGCAQISVDVRAGRISRENALEWVKMHDGQPPKMYAGVTLLETIDRINLPILHLNKLVERFTNYDLFEKAADKNGFPILKDWGC